MNDKLCDIGMVGLGVMGSNLAMNMAEHGYSVAGFDRDPLKAKKFEEEGKNFSAFATVDIKEFADKLKQPKMVMLLVPAGNPVDDAVSKLLPHLSGGDIIIDGGNSYFQETNSRAESLAKKGISFIGCGVSGGEAGARHGPSMMPGGQREAYERVRPIFEAVAANVDGSPCVAYMGPGSAGHYVKMVHNGIEYGLMELIAETYDLMKRGLGFDDRQLGAVYEKWNTGPLNGFLIEITAEIFSKIDEKTGRYLIDVIADVAKQKGTGTWTSEEAMRLQIPVPNINTAVEMRAISVFKMLRQKESQILDGPVSLYKGQNNEIIMHLGNALHLAMLMTYVQGFALLHAASRAYKYELNLADVARIWRGGCIIRSDIISELYKALQSSGNIEHLLDEPTISKLAVNEQTSLRFAVKTFADTGLPAPGMMAALSYLDSFRSRWLPANLIQAQRDYFGSHTYERIDEKGNFHTEWQK